MKYKSIVTAAVAALLVTGTAQADNGPGHLNPPPAPETDPCEINVLLPYNTIVVFPVDTPRAVAVHAMVRDLNTDEITAGGAFDRAVEDEKRTCANTWRGWLRKSW